MLLSGVLLKRLFKRSQTVWEIPDRYFVSSGMTGGRRSRLGGRYDEKLGRDDEKLGRDNKKFKDVFSLFIYILD